MPELAEQIQDLLGEAADLDHGPVQLALVERAVELADVYNELDISFHARMTLVEAAIFSDRPDIALVAFSWLLSKFDAEPDRFDSFQLLWSYKWILGHAANFPSIPKDRIDELFDDMKRRYKAEGSTLHAYWSLRRENFQTMGDKAGAKKANAKMLLTPRDHLSNCLACVQDGNVDLYAFLDDDEAAVKAAKPILSGKMACSIVPECTYAGVVLSYIRLGKPARAMECFETGYRLIGRQSTYLPQKAMYIVGLTLTSNLSRAVKLLDRHLPEALNSVVPSAEFEFYLAARLLLEALADCSKKIVPIRIPKKMELTSADGKPTVAALVEWLDARLKELALAFDTRNGNKTFAKRVRDFRKRFEYAKPCPLK